MDTHEEWRTSPLAPAHLRVSNFGRAKTVARLVSATRNGLPSTQRKGERILSPWVSKNGYFIVTLQMGDIRPKFLLHRLIASAFCPGFSPELTVNHIDGKKLNNLPSNLEWVTLAENTRLEWETGLVNLRGENHPGSKITADQVRNIRKCMNSGVSPTALARSIGVSGSLLYKIKSGARWASL